MEFLKKGEPLDVRVLRRRRAEDPTIEVVERGRERHGVVARVVVRASANMADAQWQSRLGSLQRLTLTLRKRLAEVPRGLY